MNKFQKFIIKYRLHFMHLVAISLFVFLYFHPFWPVAIGIMGILLFLTHKCRKMMKELRNEKSRLTTVVKTMFDASPYFVCIKDLEGKYVAANKAFLEVHGMHCLEDLEGKTDYDITPDKELAKRRTSFDKQILKKQETLNYDMCFTHYNGREYVLNITKSPLFDENNNLFGILVILRDITEEKNWVQRVEKEQALLKSVVDSAPYVSFIRDFEGNLIYYNKSCLEYVNFERYGTPENAYVAFFEKYKDMFFENDKKLIETKAPITYKISVGFENKEFAFNVHKIPLFNSQNEVDRILVISHDITEELKIEEQKETFVATLSHDLKTPIIAQIKAIDYILNNKKTEFDSDDKEMLQEVHNSCKYMQKMVNNLVSTHKYSSGKKILNKERFDLVKMLYECCDELKYLIDDESQVIQFDFTYLDYFIYADELEIKRVLINLLSNAIKYSCVKNPVRIVIEDKENEVDFYIANVSRYSTDECLNSYFDKYKMAQSKKKISSGLGLFLSKQIIEAHDGNVFAKKIDEECVFGFTLFKDKMFSSEEEMIES